MENIISSLARFTKKQVFEFRAQRKDKKRPKESSIPSKALRPEQSSKL